MLRTIRRDHPQWVPDDMESVITVRCPVVERSYVVGPDDFGVLWALEEGAEGGTYPAHDGHTIRDLASWRDQLTLPDLDSYDWSAVTRQAEAIDREQHLISGFTEMGLFERSYLLLSMEEALIAYLTEPEEMYELLMACRTRQE